MLDLTIAGQQVVASYYAPAPDSCALLYLDGAIGVRIVSTGLSAEEFRSAVRALVDGHADPQIVAQIEKN